MGLKIHKSSLLLFGLLFIADHCLWLLNSKIQGYTNELCWILIVIAFVGVVLKSDSKKLMNKNAYEFGALVLFTIVMAGYSTLQGMRLHGQSLMQGIMPQRFMIGAFLLYFVLVHKANKNADYANRIESVFLAVGYAELVLYIAQYFLIDKVQFLNVTVSYRLDGVRMNLGAIGVPFVIFTSINNIFKNKRLKMQDVVLLVAGLFYTFAIAKTRISLIAYVVAIIGGYLAWRKGGTKKIWVFFALILFITYLSQTSLFSYFIDGLNNIDASSQTRALGREYYIQRIMQHPILGCGYINTNNANAVAYSGMYSISTGIIGWVDLGVYGLTFFFGGIGLIWFVLLYGKMLLKSYKIASNGNLIYWMYMIYSIVIAPNGTSFIWYISSTVSFVVWLSLMEIHYKRLDAPSIINK